MLKAFLLVIVGLAGDPEHGAQFHKWGTALVDTSEKVGIARAQVTYLGDAKVGGPRVTGPATKEQISEVFAALAKAAVPDDVLYVVLLGHGNYDGSAARFNLPGPDITASEFNTLLRKVPVRNVVFVNTASSSGPFVEYLSGPGRTIITATRSGAEQYTTLFGGYFVEAFSAEEADADKNKRVSMLEAFLYAKGEVARAYGCNRSRGGWAVWKRAGQRHSQHDHERDGEEFGRGERGLQGAAQPHARVVHGRHDRDRADGHEADLRVVERHELAHVAGQDDGDRGHDP